VSRNCTVPLTAHVTTHISYFVNSSYMSRPVQAIFRDVIYKEIHLQ